MTKNPEDRGDRLGNDTEPGESERRAAVANVLKSKTFSTSPRLCSFLQYVTEEAILGRAESIRAKSIAHIVYERTSVDEMTSANVVRVEARRLRRLLEDYYENEGSKELIRIHIDKGGYAPRFEQRDTDLNASSNEGLAGAKAPPAELAKNVRPGTIAAVVAALLILFTVLYQGKESPEPAEPKFARLEREALMERSPAALEAENLVAQGRGLIFPLFDTRRQRLTLELFRAAIEVDENSAGAHTGAAQTLATLALLSFEGEQHDAYLQEARLLLERALTLAPTDTWTQSTAGWVAFVGRDYDNAMRYSERAFSLAPDDGNVMDFYGVVAIFMGEFEKAEAAADRGRKRTGANTRFANLNILAAARYYQGEFAEAARLIEENNTTGGPLSALGVVYLAATYEALGRQQDGQRMIKLLQESWPSFPVEKVLRRLHKDEERALEILDRMRALNWSG